MSVKLYLATLEMNQENLRSFLPFLTTQVKISSGTSVQRVIQQITVLEGET